VGNFCGRRACLWCRAPSPDTMVTTVRRGRLTAQKKMNCNRRVVRIGGLRSGTRNGRRTMCRPTTVRRGGLTYKSHHTPPSGLFPWLVYVPPRLPAVAGRT